MPVTTATSRVQYATNGTVGPWSVPFYFLSASDLLVVYANASGEETTLVLTTDYSVSGAGNEDGGYITTVAEYAVGGTLTIVRNVQAIQPAEFQDGDRFPAATVNRGLDRLTMLVQQLQERVNRAITFPVSEELALSLPAATGRANRVQVFDSFGDAEVSDFTVGQVAAAIDALATGSTGGAVAQPPEVQTATAGQTVFNLLEITYTPGVESLQVIVDGAVIPPSDYTETGPSVVTFAEAFDGGEEVQFRTVRYVTSGLSASSVSTGRTGVYAVGRSQQAENDDVLTTRQFGISSSKSASYNRGALQEALTSGIGKLVIVTDYVGEVILIDGPLDIQAQMEIVGYGRWGSTLRSTDLDAPVLRVTGNNVAIRGLHASYQGTPVSGGNTIEIIDAQFCDLHRVWVSSGWNCVYIEGGGNHEIVGLRCFTFENTGLFMNSAIDVNLTNFRMSAMERAGALGGIRLVGGVEAFTASQGDITLGAYGLTCETNGDGSRGTAPFYNRFNQVFFDSPLYNPAYLRYAQHLDFNACWFASAGHDPADVGFTDLTDHAGVDMENCQHVTFTGGDFYANGGNGINHFSGNKYIAYKGVRFKRNGRYRSASRAGINILAGSTDFVVSGCIFEEDADTTEFKQDTAVSVNTGASDRYVIADNLLGGCAVNDAGTGVNKRVENNY